MADQSLHAWMAPRLRALLAKAARAGFDRETAIAVVIDLIESDAFNDAATPESGG